MVVHQNITNLAGYFHFLNVRKIPYVIPQTAAPHGSDYSMPGQITSQTQPSHRNFHAERQELENDGAYCSTNLALTGEINRVLTIKTR